MQERKQRVRGEAPGGAPFPAPQSKRSHVERGVGVLVQVRQPLPETNGDKGRAERSLCLLPEAAPLRYNAGHHDEQAMGAGGGYILESGITLQGDVPLANLLAMIEEARLG